MSSCSSPHKINPPKIKGDVLGFGDILHCCFVADIKREIDSCLHTHFHLVDFCCCRIPLVQSKQKFHSMDFDLRNNLKGWVETSADKFG